MSLDTDAASSELRNQGTGRAYTSGFGRAPNSGVTGNLGIRDRLTRIQASGIRAPNSGVSGNLGVRDRPTRIPASGTLAPNSGVRGNLGVRDRPTRIQARQGPADPNSGASGIRAPNSGVRGNLGVMGPADPNSGVKTRRHQTQLRLPGPPTYLLFSHGRQARGGRNSGVKFRRQKHFRRHLSGNRFHQRRVRASGAI